jgi:hypothetical protein
MNIMLNVYKWANIKIKGDGRLEKCWMPRLGRVLWYLA